MAYIMPLSAYRDPSKVLAHIGVLERSGRFPWGSGEDPYQRLRTFQGLKAKLRRDGADDGQIAKELGFESTREFRAYNTIYDAYLKRHDIERVENMRGHGKSVQEISKETGLSDSKVRSLLKPGADRKVLQFENDRDYFKAQADERGMIDVSTGINSAAQITDTRKIAAIQALRDEGYGYYTVWEKGKRPGETVPTKVLTKPGITREDAFKNRNDIYNPTSKVDDFDASNPLGIKKPIAIDESRVSVVYGDEGGARRDGMIYIRPGVKDLNMRDSHFSQVRIQIGDDSYMKGVAAYSNDLPDGVDIQFFTDKKTGTPLKDVLKPLKRDKKTGDVDYTNPFGSVIDQIKDDDGNVTSALNIVNEEADWKKWSKNLPSQFLAKQSTSLARSQLDMTRANKQAELDEINALTNPTVKKYMLNKFAESADGAAVHLKAAHLPNQRTHVLLAVDSMKDNEIYAPNYQNGERVSLVRFPHGGKFEIPELIVNNNNKEGEALIGKNSPVGVGINATVAERLSGADFDGDTVLVLPNNSGRVKSAPPLKKLEGFNPKVQYGLPPGTPKEKAPFKTMKKSQIPREMGGITNLIADMQMFGATDDEVARAVRHSMVVIDAEKHGLDYTRSAKDNRISELKKKYQVDKSATGSQGAATLITRASSQQRVDVRRPRIASEGGPIDPRTGELRWSPKATEKQRFMTTYPHQKPDGSTDYDRPVHIQRQFKSTKMAETNDARTLLSTQPSPMEVLYADHANGMKALANKARLDYLATEEPSRDPVAYKKYEPERLSLEYKLDQAKANAPKERRAQRVANEITKVRVAENPDMDSEDRKKVYRQALEQARVRTGSQKSRVAVVPTEREWEAIQANAISKTKLNEILQHGDTDSIVELAMPKKGNSITTSQKARIKAMARNGYTNAEIADQLGISTSTVSDNL